MKEGWIKEGKKKFGQLVLSSNLEYKKKKVCKGKEEGNNDRKRELDEGKREGNTFYDAKYIPD